MKTPDAVLALEALAQQSRLDIFRLLVEAGPAGMPAGAIAESMQLPGATLSFHLSQLRHAGLLGCRRDGRSLIYTAEFGVMNELVAYLTDNCCGGNASQCASVCVPVCAPAVTAQARTAGKRQVSAGGITQSRKRKPK